MKNNTKADVSFIREREITLLDGRIIKIPLFNDLKLTNHDLINFVLNFDIFDEQNILHNALNNLIINLIQTRSISYVATTTRAFANWFGVGGSKYTYLDIDSLESLNNVSNSYLPFITPILRKLASIYPDLISEIFKDFLDNMHNWDEKNVSYLKLISNDPEKGALTYQELENLTYHLNLEFIQNKLSIYDYTLCWFLIATGVRPVQISRLKLKDIQISDKNVMLSIPLAKAEGIIDQGYMLRKAPTALADCLIRLIKIIPNYDDNNSVFNLNPSEISKRVISIFGNLNTYSERLETKIPVNAYRFRYTLATRALADGASDHAVARLLTHRSISCIQYYRASMPELQAPLQKAIGEEMSFLSNAFRGKIIHSIKEATFQDSVIADFYYFSGQNLGACGTRAKCYQNAPISCLSCNFFEPFKDAPWNELLSHLLKDQAKESSSRIREISTVSINAVNEIISTINLENC